MTRHDPHVLALRIVDATAMLVRSALEGRWSELSGIATHRRELLRLLELNGSDGEQSCVNALQQAVAESEAALVAICPRLLH